MGRLSNYLLVIAIFTIFIFLQLTTVCFSYNIEGGGGHEQITDWTVTITQRNMPEIFKGININELKSGTVSEDKGVNPLSHFYSPSTGWGLMSWADNAKIKAQSYYYSAIKNKSSVSLGHTLHLLQDMASPSHANNASHLWQYTYKTGYEYWVTNNWEKVIQPYLSNFFDKNPQFGYLIEAGNIEGYMDAMAGYTYYGSYSYDFDGLGLKGIYTDVNTVSPYESEYNSKMLLPAIIRLGGGLLKTYCKNINCGGPFLPSSSGPPPGNDHPDDTFDVASRFVELEQLDPTKELWKDIYGRTGIKKGYIGLFLEKELSKAYQQLATATTEVEFNQRAVEFQTVLNNAQASSKHTFEETYHASPDVALLSNGYVDENADLLLKKLQEPIREIKESFNANALKNQPVLVVPSGGLYGYENSTFIKSTLDEYVKNGGTLIAFGQQHGYEYSILPTPDGKPLAAYGWTEDQSCLWNGTYVDTYHQMMSAISTASVSAGVDGYFASYPENSTILLRRTVSGQPAMLMYEQSN